MELSERLLNEIAVIFSKVEYGKIIFSLSPEKKTLDYSIETTFKLPIEEWDKKPNFCLTKTENSA